MASFSPVEKIAQDDQVQSALKSLESNMRETVDLAIAIQQIPSPTFEEGRRADYIESLYRNNGLSDVRKDDIHNVFGRIAGSDSQSPVVVSAHLDTVFSQSTDLAVSYEGDEEDSHRIYGPGLADNALGVAGLITLARALAMYDFPTSSDIWLAANVCEEGLGNLRGMREVVDSFGEAKAYLVVEGGSFGHVFHEAVGVRRYLIEAKTPGGHSWGDFGTPNAIHELSRIIASISNLSVPGEPKTTFNVGVIEGGTVINAIASAAKCQLDIRSADKEALDDLTAKVKGLVSTANAQSSVSVEMKQIGERPSGRLPRQTPVVAMAAEALRQVGCDDVDFMGGSTDASVPISLGLPAVCIGLAKSGNTHRLDEFVDITHLHQGLGQLLLLTLAAAGYEVD